MSEERNCVMCKAPAVAGDYCRPCLEHEIDTYHTMEDLEAASDLYDLLVTAGHDGSVSGGAA